MAGLRISLRLSSNTVTDRRTQCRFGWFRRPSSIGSVHIVQMQTKSSKECAFNLTKEKLHMPKGYSKAQIRLHWVIFFLVLLQFTLNGPMSAGWDLIKKGEEPVLHPLVVQHVVSGLLVLMLVIWRLSIRLKRGTPPLPKEEHPALKGLAHLTHWTLYLMLILMPLSGMVAVFADFVPAGDAHGVLKAVLLALVVLHVLGAIFQQFVLKTNILARMRIPDTD